MTESIFDADGITDSQFDAWLSGATLAQGSVDILQNPALLGEWEDLVRRHERAQHASKAEGGIADDNPLGALEAEAELLLARIEASRTTFHVRALVPGDLDAILAAHPIKSGPRFAGKVPPVQPNPTEAQAKAWLGMMDSYRIQREAWEAEHAEEIAAHREETRAAMTAQGAEKIARAVTRVEQAGALVAERLTVEQVIAMSRRIGDTQLALIADAIDRVSTAAPEVPAGFLSHTSGDVPD